MAPFIPHPLFDRIIEIYKLKNDAALARALKMSPSNISRYRFRHRPICAHVILRIHDATGWSIKIIKELIQKA
jgi:plasmid maintenance system antidote protein VapI